PLILLAACGKSKAPPASDLSTAPDHRVHAASDDALIAEAKKFVAEADAELKRLYIEASVAEWANQTDITPEHEAAAAKASEALANGLTKLIKASRKFESVQSKLDPDTRRQLWLLKIAGQPAPDDPAQAEELAKIAAEMTSIYGKGKVCDASKKKAGAPTQKQLDDLAAKLAAETDEKKKAKLAKDRDAMQKKF